MAEVAVSAETLRQPPLLHLPNIRSERDTTYVDEDQKAEAVHSAVFDDAAVRGLSHRQQLYSDGRHHFRVQDVPGLGRAAPQPVGRVQKFRVRVQLQRFRHHRPKHVAVQRRLHHRQQRGRHHAGHSHIERHQQPAAEAVSKLHPSAVHHVDGRDQLYRLRLLEPGKRPAQQHDFQKQSRGMVHRQNVVAVHPGHRAMLEIRRVRDADLHRGHCGDRPLAV